jgi:lipoprotein NlpD
MKLTGYLLSIIFGSVLGLTGCTHGSSYSYSYYTGKKNPRVIRESPQSAAKKKNQQTRSSDKPYHVVSKGETLYSIAWEYGHDVRDVARWNKIRAPYTIYPQQKIRLRPRPAPTVAKTRPRQSAKVTTTKLTKPATKRKNTVKIGWQWPTKGKIIGRYSAHDSGKKGLDIAGKIGQRVYAAAEGQVVYSGSGLRGYGKLIIIKHNDTYFSAYAHNNRLFVTEKQKVKKGQHIANMGSSEASRAMLHFEVRRNGKPVDPLRYLPKRR